MAPGVQTPIGLYANSSSSKLFDERKIQAVDREILKEKVRVGALKLLVGTDAASTGLNLQRLGSLINLDLPWNQRTIHYVCPDNHNDDALHSLNYAQLVGLRLWHAHLRYGE